MSKANQYLEHVSLRNNDEAVSPVIGTILMVAITVIIAAVIAAFVFGFAGTMPKAPKIAYIDAQRVGKVVTLTNINAVATLSDIHVYAGTVAAANEIKTGDAAVTGDIEALLSTLNGAVKLDSAAAAATGYAGTVPTTASYKLIITASVNGATNQVIEELNI